MENNISFFLAQTPYVIGAILFGLAGCLALHKGRVGQFFTSSLFVKVVMWLPLYLIFCVASWSVTAAAIFGGLVAVGSLYEWRRNGRKQVAGYLVYFLVGCMAIPLSLGVAGPNLWMTVVMASVLSDVTAFFTGKSLGRHRLPASLNSRKSIEGVIGQVIGGCVGVLITGALFATSVPWWAGLAIGLLSAIGDLSNSYAKRKLGIDEWGKTIPGHGGVMDRFSSLNAVLIGMTLLLVASVKIG